MPYIVDNAVSSNLLYSVATYDDCAVYVSNGDSEHNSIAYRCPVELRSIKGDWCKTSKGRSTALAALLAAHWSFEIVPNHDARRNRSGGFRYKLAAWPTDRATDYPGMIPICGPDAARRVTLAACYGRNVTDNSYKGESSL